MNTKLTNSRLREFKKDFLAFLKRELDENGEAIVRDMTYRFAMVQFRTTKGFTPSGNYFIPRVLSDMQIEFGKIFENYANYCFSLNYSVPKINWTLRKWLIEILDEIITDS